jgi:1-acyl-sn-glycerol-3-phosphate acyltransferase
LGIGKLYLESGVPILPVAMKGTYELMPPGGGVKISRSVEVIIGKKLEFLKELEAAKGLDKESEEYKKICIKIAKTVEEKVGERLG